LRIHASIPLYGGVAAGRGGFAYDILTTKNTKNTKLVLRAFYHTEITETRRFLEGCLRSIRTVCENGL